MIAFVFYKKKTAYELLRGRVGSEMCIRDGAGEVSRVAACVTYANRWATKGHTGSF